jgi:hypothetical protein
MAVGLITAVSWAVGAGRGQAARGPAAAGQSAKPAPDAKKGEVSLGSYSLVTTVFEASATAPKLRGCEALDRATLTVRDANTIGYHIVSHGAAVELSVNAEVHDILPVSSGSEETPWHAGEVIFVAVPKATPAYRFSSEVLVGTWNGEAVVFEVGKDLPEGAKKALEDLGVKQDLGDRVLYSFRVKEPEKKP